MRLLTKESSLNFLSDMNYFEGANVNGINVNLTSKDSSICSKDSISVEFQLEGSNRLVRLEMRDIVRYRLTDLTGVSLFGLSGDPHSLMLVWTDSSVVVGIGICVNDIEYQDLVTSDFFIEAGFVYID